MSDKTLAIKYFMQTHQSFDAARSELYKMGIKTSYNDEVIIYSTLHTSKHNLDNAYVQESNGLILSRNSYKPLVVPPRSLRFNINTDIANTFLHQGLYHIYKATDGTCFNMYYYNDKWVISTAKGYAMNDTKWESKTYQEIISDCLESIGFTWHTFTNALDINRSYSFGFKHPNFHKFFEGTGRPIYKLWFIQSVVTNENLPDYLWASDQSPIDKIPTQERYPLVVSNLRELYKQAANSCNDFLKSSSICYGFILRSVNAPITGNNSDLFIESSLMRNIRHFWYENNIIIQCHKNKWNKELAITLHAYLGKTNRNLFISMYPQYRDWFDMHAILVNSISNNMTDKTEIINKSAKYEKKITNKPTESAAGPVAAGPAGPAAATERAAAERADALTSIHEVTSEVTSEIKDEIIDSDLANRLNTKNVLNQDDIVMVANEFLRTFTDNVEYDLIGKNKQQIHKVYYEYICHPDSLELLMTIAKPPTERNTAPTAAPTAVPTTTPTTTPTIEV